MSGVRSYFVHGFIAAEIYTVYKFCMWMYTVACFVMVLVVYAVVIWFYLIIQALLVCANCLMQLSLSLLI